MFKRCTQERILGNNRAKWTGKQISGYKSQKKKRWDHYLINRDTG